MPDFTLALCATLVLTLLGGLAVALTRLRLRHTHAGLPLTFHTAFGGSAFVLWLVFLLTESGPDWNSLIGVAGLGCWWVTSIAGLVLLARWKPTGGGKRAAQLSTAADSWSSTPWLSLIAHVGVFIGVGWFSYAYVMSVV